MKLIKVVKSPYVSLYINFVYAISNSLIGLFAHSWYFITVGAYYVVLTTTRFSVLKIKRKANDDKDLELFAKRITGILLVVLSFCLIGINVLTAVLENTKKFHEITMIAIAAYTFSKITFAIIGLVKSRRFNSPVVVTLRNISFADAVVSLYTLQRSMLVSFPGMSNGDIQLFNILTGTAVYITVLLLGINLIGGKIVDMAKNKMVEANEKIAKSVTDTYKKIEKGVVGGYKKIEKGVVDSYFKVEDKFIDTYLTKDGETLEEAKKRLKKESK